MCEMYLTHWINSCTQMYFQLLLLDTDAPDSELLTRADQKCWYDINQSLTGRFLNWHELISWSFLYWRVTTRFVPVELQKHSSCAPTLVEQSDAFFHSQTIFVWIRTSAAENRQTFHFSCYRIHVSYLQLIQPAAATDVRHFNQRRLKMRSCYLQ